MLTSISLQEELYLNAFHLFFCVSNSLYCTINGLLRASTTLFLHLLLAKRGYMEQLGAMGWIGASDREGDPTHFQRRAWEGLPTHHAGHSSATPSLYIPACNCNWCIHGGKSSSVLLHGVLMTWKRSTKSNWWRTFLLRLRSPSWNKKALDWR
jgi:hypothetical protein